MTQYVLRAGLLGLLLLFFAFMNAQGLNKPAAFASPLQDTKWKSYVGEPLNDTLIWKFDRDSFFIQTQTAEVLLTGIYTCAHDTLAFYDLGGQYACPINQTGKYRFAINGDVMQLNMISDECMGRAMAINSGRMKRVKPSLPSK